jgi:hypothetical protein
MSLLFVRIRGTNMYVLEQVLEVTLQTYAGKWSPPPQIRDSLSHCHCEVGSS